MTTVLIIGGGYGGIRALETLAAQAEGTLKITLVDQHTYHYLQTESYNLLVSNRSLEQTFVYLPALVASLGDHTHFVCDEALHIEKQTLICRNSRLDFDYAIIATGSVTRFSQDFHAKGAYVLGVKSLRATLHAKHFFEDELFERLEGCHHQKTFTIVVIGAGLSGVEVAAQMQEYFNRYTKENVLRCGRIHIKLIAKHILKTQSSKVIAKVTRRLKHLGVELLAHHVSSIEEQHVVLDTSDTINFDFTIVTGGIAPSPFIEQLAYKKNTHGFLAIDAYLRLSPTLFAIGDAAALHNRAGEAVAPTAQSAEASGTIAANNIMASINEQPLQRAHIQLRGMAIALGGRYALVVTPFGLCIGGVAGWLIKQAIEKYYKVRLKRQAARVHNIHDVCPQPG